MNEPQADQCEATAANTGTKLHKVFQIWHAVASSNCKRGFFGELTFTLKIRDGVPELQRFVREESGLV